jgi:drug/metabolite transporter (DMT)-like permease
MKDSPALHLKTYLFIFFIVLFAPLGNVLLGKGMKGIGSAKNWTLGDLLPVSVRILSSPYIWLGIGCLLAFFVSYMLVLTWADYSYVQPASSFSYAVVAILGYFLLGETINSLRWAGIAIITLGVFIVGHTHPRSTEKI